MAVITIDADSVPLIETDDETLLLRLRATSPYTTYEGVSILSGEGIYIEYECPVSGHIAAVPPITIYSTTDNISNNDPRWTAEFWDASGTQLRAVYFANYQISSTPTTTTKADLDRQNAAPIRDFINGVYNTLQIDSLLAALTSVAQKATALVYGVVKLSVAAVNPTIPIAVGDNDPRMLGRYENIDGLRFAEQFQFDTTSNTAVSSLGVEDPTAAPTLSLSAGGSLVVDQPYWVRYAWVTAAGITAASPEARIVVTADRTITVTVPSIPAGATGWNVYVGTVLGQLTKQGSTITAVTAYAFSSAPTTNGAEWTLVNTTAPTVITPASMDKIYSPAVYAQNDAHTMKQPLLIAAGTGQEEIVYVVSRTATTFTATFTKTHSVGFTIETATGGISEAVMDIPIGNAGGSNENGGIVYMPSGLTTTKAPIEFRQSVHFQGKQGLPFTAIGGDNPAAQGSQVHYVGTSPHKGAFQNIAVSLTNRMADVSFSNFTVSSATNGIYLGGAAGIFGMSLDKMAVFSSPTTDGYAAIKIETSEPQFLTFDKVRLTGYYCWFYRGGNMFGWSMKDSIVFGNSATGIHFYIDAGYSGSTTLGGNLSLTNTVTEYGGGPIIYANLVSLFLDQFGTADWTAATSSTPQIVIDQTVPGFNAYLDMRGCGIFQGGSPSGPAVKFQATGSATLVRVPTMIQNSFFFGTWASGTIDFGDLNASPITLYNNIGLDTRIGLTAADAQAVIGLAEPNTLRRLFTAFNNLGSAGNGGVELAGWGGGLTLHTNNFKNVTLSPSNTAVDRTLIIPDFGSNDTFVGLAANQTLLNKVLTSPTITTPAGIVKGDVGLGNVDNTSDANKPVSTAQQTALDLKANLASPALTGTPVAPTAAAATNTTQIATTAHVFAERTNAATLTNKTLTSPVMTAPTLGMAVATSIAIGSGTAITKVVKGTVTIDPASINATTFSSQTFTLTGAVAGDSLIFTPPAAGLTSGVIVTQSFVSAADTITVVFYNFTGGAIDLASASWTYTLIRS